MAQLYYRYSTMNAGKSLEILKIANNYREQGKNVIIFVPELDNRYGTGKVTSRIGISEEAITIGKGDDIVNLIEPYISNKGIEADCILIDEAQFLSYEQVVSLTVIVDEFNVPVICYGLKNDFKNNLFEGSKWLLVYADKIEEVKTVCWFCNRKATMIVKYINNNPTFAGNQIEIGGNDKYKSVCRQHYFDERGKWEDDF